MQEECCCRHGSTGYFGLLWLGLVVFLFVHCQRFLDKCVRDVLSVKTAPPRNRRRIPEETLRSIALAVIRNFKRMESSKYLCFVLILLKLLHPLPRKLLHEIAPATKTNHFCYYHNRNNSFPSNLPFVFEIILTLLNQVRCSVFVDLFGTLSLFPWNKVSWYNGISLRSCTKQKVATVFSYPGIMKFHLRVCINNTKDIMYRWNYHHHFPFCWAQAINVT